MAVFREQFQEEYFAELRKRHIKDHVTDPTSEANVQIKKGDLVIIQSDILKRNLWQLALVTEVIKSPADGKVRAARLQTKEGTTTRPLQKLYPLVEAEQLRPESKEDHPAEDAEDEKAENDEQDADEHGEADAPDDHQGAAGTVTSDSNQSDSAPASRPPRASKERAREFLKTVSQDLLKDD